MPGEKNKPKGRYEFTPTGQIVPDYNYLFVEKHNTQKLPKENPTQYIQIKAKEGRESELFFQAAIAELYRALGPTNGAPKTRVQLDANGQPIALLSKVVTGFQGLTSGKLNQSQDHLKDFMIPAAGHLALQYVFEEVDLNRKNIDINQNTRIDFGLSFVDGFKFTADDDNDFRIYFSGIPCIENFFLMHPIDLNLFPNMVIAKPWNVLYLIKNNKRHIELLNKASVSTEFNKKAHQYFLKSLLFDKTLIKPILAAHLADSEKLDKFANYIDARMHALKLSLVQVPKFRKSVIDHFSEYKENILNEIKVYNQEFETKPGENYQSRLINLKRIEQQLDELHQIISACDAVPHQGDLFAQFTSQVFLALDNESDKETKLCELVNKQASATFEHLKLCGHLAFEKVLLKYLLQVYGEIDAKDPLKKAEILFYADQKITQALIAKERGADIYTLKEIIYEFWDKDSHDIEFEINYNKVAFIQEKISKEIENVDPFELLYQYNFPKYEDIENLMGYPSHTDLQNDTLSKKDFFRQINLALESCMAYARDINKEDCELATLYLDKLNILFVQLEAGMHQRKDPQAIVVDMLKEIQIEEFNDHRGIKQLFAPLLNMLINLFYKIISVDLCATAKPCMLTRRAALLEKVVETCEVAWNYRPER